MPYKTGVREREKNFHACLFSMRWNFLIKYNPCWGYHSPNFSYFSRNVREIVAKMLICILTLATCRERKGSKGVEGCSMWNLDGWESRIDWRACWQMMLKGILGCSEHHSLLPIRLNIYIFLEKKSNLSFDKEDKRVKAFSPSFKKDF